MSDGKEKSAFMSHASLSSCKGK